MITRKPTIYEALADKLGRTPTASELKADFNRILQEGMIDLASKRKLPHQKGSAA
jgi:hypothetical protein